MSSLAEGFETHAGQLYKLLLEAGTGSNLTVYYEPGIQWHHWGTTLDVMQGRGINRQIKRAYGVLASRYREGDMIILAGYSRGAYAVRSLAGVIDQVGLITPKHATERNVQLAYRHYRRGGRGAAAEAFRKRMCHDAVEIEAVAVWDTVKALGFRVPILWRWSQVEHAFHNHALGASVRNGFHALALDEGREAYAPVLWGPAGCPCLMTMRHALNLTRWRHRRGSGVAGLSCFCRARRVWLGATRPRVSMRRRIFGQGMIAALRSLDEPALSLGPCLSGDLD